MGNMLKQHYTTACLAATAIALAACTQEADDNTTRLPEGKYPMTFTAIAPSPLSATPTTRVADADDGSITGSSWNDGDRICVTVKALSDNYTAHTSCTLKADGTATSYDPTIYWHSTGAHSVTAWYANISSNHTSDTAIDISDQSNGLAYVLKSEPAVHTFYNGKSMITLHFTHQLAKVRVLLTDNDGNAINPAAAAVEIRQCHTSCDINEGDITPIGNAYGNVRMMRPTAIGDYFEANVIPDADGMSRQMHAMNVEVNGKKTTASLTQAVRFEKGKVYTFTIRVK